MPCCYQIFRTLTVDFGGFVFCYRLRTQPFSKTSMQNARSAAPDQPVLPSLAGASPPSANMDAPFILDLMSQVCKALDGFACKSLVVPPLPAGLMAKLANGRRLLLEKLLQADAVTVYYLLKHPVLPQLKHRGLLHLPLNADEKKVLDYAKAIFVQGWQNPKSLNVFAIMSLYHQAFELPLVTEGLAHADRNLALAYLDYCCESAVYIYEGDDQKHVDFLKSYIDWCSDRLSDPKTLSWAAQNLMPTFQKLNICGPLTAESDISGAAKARARLIQTLNGLLQSGNVQNLKALDRRLVPTKNRKIRIGYMVSTLNFGSDTKTLLAEIGEFDPEKIEIYLYSRDTANMASHHNVAFYRRLFGKIAEARSLRGLPADKLINLIRADELDIFIFYTSSDYGFGFYDLALAHRVAPLQIAPNHMVPISTWLDSFDYHILPRVRDELVPKLVPQASEKLILTPGALLAYDRINETQPSHVLNRASLGIRDDEIMLLCCGAAPKIVPSVCDSFARTLKALPNAKLVLATLHPDFGGERLWPIMETRMGLALKRHDVGRDRVVMLNRMEPQDMPQLLHLSDLYLSQWPLGGATWITMCLDSGTPIIVKDCDLMHGLGNQSLLHGSGFDELVAADADDFVRMAIELATDKQKQQAVRAKLKTANGRMQHNDLATFSRKFQDLYLKLVDAVALSEGESGARSGA